jgi:hypothetical protein
VSLGEFHWHRQTTGAHPKCRSALRLASKRLPISHPRITFLVNNFRAFFELPAIPADISDLVKAVAETSCFACVAELLLEVLYGESTQDHY